MVVYVTYRVPVEVELEIETGEIMDVHVMDEMLEGPLGVFDYELQPLKGRLKNTSPCYTLKRNCRHGVVRGL